MKIQVGFRLAYESADWTPMVFMLNVHPSRATDLIAPDRLRLAPSRSITPYIDGFGNKCVRVLAPPGELHVSTDTIVADGGKPDRVHLGAEEHAVADLPHETLVYLLASRYCETDLMMDRAWEHAVGEGCKPFATSFTNTSRSAINTLARPRVLGKPLLIDRACVAILHISPSQCVGASTFQRGIARAIWAILACRPIPHPWISALGSKPL